MADLVNCAINDHNKNINIRVKLDGVKVGHKELEKKVNDIINHEVQLNGRELESLEEIELKQSDENGVVYKVGEAPDFNVMPPSKDAGVNVQIVKTAASRFPQRQRTFKEIKKSLLGMWPSSTPIISFFWHVLLKPLCHLIHFIHPGYVLNTKSLFLSDDAHGERALIAGLKEIKKAVIDSDDPEDAKIAAFFDEALEFHKQWKAADPAVKERLAKEMTTKLLQKLGSEKPGESLMMIPTGYWDLNGVFQPILMSLSKNKDGDLQISEMGYGAEKDIVRDYVLKGADYTQQDQVTKLETLFFKLSPNHLSHV